VDVGRQIRWLVERAHAHEGESLNAAVMAPEGNLAGRAAMNDMRSPALGRNRDPLRLAEEALDPVGLDQRVEHEGAAGLPLTVLAMAAVDKHRLRREADTAPRRRRTSL
jgi:hypothetical protein